MHLFLRGSCRTRISADDVLGKIDALMDCQWCSPIFADMQACVGTLRGP
ncbi:MAG: hypothetical protein GDA36_05500 [Rhodobacteraceae bacterium]|nr:hypothetical protein [Paracoccaceae bacterium]